jgi:hypothetical protein
VRIFLSLWLNSATKNVVYSVLLLLDATGSLDETTGEWIGGVQVVEEAKQAC